MANHLKPPTPDSSSFIRDLIGRNALPAAGSPAFRALLAAFTTPSSGGRADPSATHSSTEHDETSAARSFIERQMALLRNVVADGATEVIRFQAHVEHLLLLRASDRHQSASALLHTLDVYHVKGELTLMRLGCSQQLEASW